MSASVEPSPARVRFVLVNPSHPGNVGAAARAMRTMGFRELVLVAPRVRRAHRHPDALAFASGALDVLAGCTVVDSLDAALAPVHLAVAMSAAAREFAPPVEAPESIAATLRRELADDPDLRVALVFGNERTGLTLGQAQRCQHLCAIPGAADYGSLNLAQAVQIMAYLLRRELVRPGSAAAAEQVADDPGAPDAAATLGQLAGMIDHVERTLVRIGFLDPLSPKRLVPRLRRLANRARPTRQEVDIVRGVCTRIERIT